jgi:hypothetical protein
MNVAALAVLAASLAQANVVPSPFTHLPPQQIGLDARRDAQPIVPGSPLDAAVALHPLSATVPKGYRRLDGRRSSLAPSSFNGA